MKYSLSCLMYPTIPDPELDGRYVLAPYEEVQVESVTSVMQVSRLLAMPGSVVEAEYVPVQPDELGLVRQLLTVDMSEVSVEQVLVEHLAAST